MRKTAAEWAERVRAWRESGKTAPEFVEGKDFSVKTLHWWAGEFARRSRRKPRRAPRLRIARVVPRPGEGGVLTVVIGAARIEVRAGFDRALLRGVVDTLGGAR